MRRRPVPFEFQEEHILRFTIRRMWGSGFRRTSRAKAVCSCGARFPNGERDNTLDAPGVRDAHKDHIERVFYGEADYRDEQPEWAR